MQMYELGQFLRKRYSSFVADFNREDVSNICFPLHFTTFQDFLECNQRERSSTTVSRYS